MNQCGAKTRAGTPCQQPAGWGTEHPGEGRCKLHGGASLRGHLHPRFKHGIHAQYRYVVYSARARGVVGLNDAKVLFDEDGICRGLVQIGNGPQIHPPQPLRKEDLEAFRRLPGYAVELEPGVGALIRNMREVRARARTKCKAIEARREALYGRRRRRDD